MTMIPCPECRKKISDSAESCPKCGYKLSPEKIAEVKAKEAKARRSATGCLVVIAIVIGLLCAGVLSSGKTGNKRRSGPTTSRQETASKPRDTTPLTPPAIQDRVTIGQWNNEPPSLAGTSTIYYEGDGLFIEETYPDGSAGKTELVEVVSPLGRRFDPKKQGSSSPSVGTPEAREYILSMLAELEAFKSSAEFRFYGFGAGGPHSSWLKSIQSNRDYPGASFEQRVAIGDLLMLGLSYLRTDGLENDATRFSRKQITEAIQEEVKSEEPAGFGDHWIITDSGGLECRDKDGLIYKATKMK